jgi:ATP-dependent DNA helicase RecQ
MEYLPVRYSANSRQISNRQAVYDFKDGRCIDYIFNAFVKHILSEIDWRDKSDYLICFIPASTGKKTIRRYSNLARKLNAATGVKASLSAIKRCVDQEAGHLTGKKNNPLDGLKFNPSEFRGKKVFLIDDVITRGRTFDSTANKLMEYGADDVTGLFVAMTSSPNRCSSLRTTITCITPLFFEK